MSDHPTGLGTHRRLITVSNRLPVTLEGDCVTRSSGGLVAALEGLNKDPHETKWIGWPGTAFSEEGKRREVERKLGEEYGCIPVFLSEEDASGFYEGFSNSSIWPLLHSLPNYLRYEPAWWEDYQSVNRTFAAKVLEIAGEDDLVWVHDYQLMLLPALLRAAAPRLKIGFFLHTPFPPFEIFRCHPRRSELLSGMLGANRIGFQAFGYLRHFCSTVQRLLGIETEFTRIPNEAYDTALGIYPIGINASKFEEILDSEEFRQRRSELQSGYSKRRLVISVERMDYTKGILHRLEAIENFLRASDKNRTVQFIFISAPSREGIKEYRNLLEEVEARIGKLNGKYATLLTTPIHFIHNLIPFVDLCSLYSLADVALVTPLIDGMNLVAKEFLACQRENAGLLVLSEFAGAAEELFNAMLVNPYDSAAVAGILNEALDLPVESRRQRTLPMRDRVMRYDAGHWARSFIGDLASDSIHHLRPAEDTESVRRKLAGLTASDRSIALFLDYDGTLREIETEPDAATPDAELKDLLTRFGRHANLEITIISGRPSESLEKLVGSYPFRLVAEHGATAREPGRTAWHRFDGKISYAWKLEILPIFRIYEQATPGSWIEQKSSSIAWHYRRANEEFGARKANQLTEQLSALTANKPIKIRHGRKIVEATPAEINKGAAVARALDQKPVFAALCAGDDLTDESMFELNVPDLITIKVGSGPTKARFNVSGPAAFRQLLASCFCRPAS
jgi:trehalose 6-phosphate synthase/phosphatase